MTVCNSWLYDKVCSRGENCRNAHQLIGARDLARMNRERASSASADSRPPPGVTHNVVKTQPKPKAKNKTFNEPAFHPDHPWVKSGKVLATTEVSTEARPRSASTSVSGNGRGQTSGASTVQASAPQVQASAPQTSAASEIAARQTVRESLSQISSQYAQVQSVQEGTWFASMDNALALVRQAFPGSMESPTSRQSPKPRTVSQGASSQGPFEDPRTPGN